MPIQPILYQDDVARLSLDLESAQMGNNKMEAMAESKLLDYNLDKSCFILVGQKNPKKEMQEQVDAKPLQLCGRNMKQETEAKYLGDWLSSFDLSASVDVTIKKRKGLTYLAMYDNRTVIEDCRSMVC